MTESEKPGNQRASSSGNIATGESAASSPVLRWREEPGADRSTTRRTPGATSRAICATVLAASLWLSLESTTMRLRGRRDWESISGRESRRASTLFRVAMTISKSKILTLPFLNKSTNGRVAKGSEKRPPGARPHDLTIDGSGLRLRYGRSHRDRANLIKRT